MARKPKTTAAPPARSKPEKPTIDKVVGRWIDEITATKKLFTEWWDLSDKIAEKYKDVRSSSSTDERRYNMLWSTMQTLQPLVYNSPPTPHVSRRHNDRDPVARDASMILQRALTCTLDGDELNDALTEARDDYLLTSRGVVWHKYTPYFALRDSEEKTPIRDSAHRSEVGEDGIDIKEDDETGDEYFHEKYEAKVYEECDSEHVYYKDFLHGPAAKWRHVPWVARRVPMTRDELIKRFGEKMGRLPPLTIHTRTASSDTDESDEAKGHFAKAEVWEIWDRKKKHVYWLCPQFKDSLLDSKEDLLGLDGFFPCPRPAFGTRTNESLVPVPDYKLWQDVALELDDVTYRISLLTDSLRVAGVYDRASGDDLKKLLKDTRSNAMIPVQNWAMFAEKGGLKGAVDFLPIENVIVVMDKLVQARQRLVQELYEITGISDILRGASDPRETAKAQQMKGNFASKRLKTRQEAISRMARESFEIMTQIICSQYSDDYIRMISSAEQILVNPITQQYDPARFDAAMKLLRENPLRRFRIKVDEYTLSGTDQQEDQAQRVQFTQAISQFLGAALPMAMQLPATVPLLGELLLFAVRGFPNARSTEASIEDAIMKLSSAPPPPQPAEGGKMTGKTPEEIAVLNRQVDLKAEELGLKKQTALTDERFRKMELEMDRLSMLLQHQNRDRESSIRENKQNADTHLRSVEIESSNRDAERQDMRAQEDVQRQEVREQNSARREDIRVQFAAQREDGNMQAQRQHEAKLAFSKRKAA